MTPFSPDQLEQALLPWRQVAQQADAFFARVLASHSGNMECGMGCVDCCQPGLTVTRIEALAMLHGLDRADPEALLRLRPDQTHHCSLLDPSTNGCAIYPFRPLVCRTHGLPILEEDQISCCPLNFQTEVPKDAILNGGLLAAKVLAVGGVVFGEASDKRVGIREILELGWGCLG